MVIETKFEKAGTVIVGEIGPRGCAVIMSLGGWAEIELFKSCSNSSISTAMWRCQIYRLFMRHEQFYTHLDSILQV